MNRQLLAFVLLIFTCIGVNAQRFVKAVGTIDEMAALRVSDINSNVFVADSALGGLFTLVGNQTATNTTTKIASVYPGYSWLRMLGGTSYSTNLYTTNIYAGNIYTTNLYVTNLYSSNIFTTNIWATYSYLTNLYTSNAYITNLYTTNAYITNLHAGDIFTTNLYVTNLYSSNIFTTNVTANYAYLTNLYTSNLYTTNITYGSGLVSSNTMYDIWTNTTSTNFVIDMARAVQTWNLTTAVTLMQTTNRPASETNALLSMLVLNNFSGGNLEITNNPGAAWKVDGTTWPVTVTNGDCITFTFMARGPYETNVLVGSKWFH